MKTKAVRSWLELAELAERLAEQDWVFRGEPSSRHALRPGAGRFDDLGHGRHRFTESDERAALDRFKTDALPYLDYHPPVEHDLEWLAIAQHYGMQTRLLDWTESLLIAAFFAVERGGTDGPALIYGVHGLPAVGPAEDPFSLTEISVYRPSRLSPRMAPQWSVFTVHPDPSEDFRDNKLVCQWPIPGKRSGRHIKLVLDSCGINYATLYPDLNGLARHIYWRYKWGMKQTRPANTPTHRSANQHST